jgi:hypothetical protein
MRSLLSRRRLATAAIVVALGPAARAVEPEAGSLEYPVKAAFLFQFARFVEWPEDAAESGSPFEICVVGGDPFGAALERAIEGKRVNGRALAVKRFRGLEELRPCPILFVGPEERRLWPAVLDRVGATPTLTVGEGREFVEAGGVIGFLVEDNRVRFAVNVGAAGRSHLRLSSRLLAVARSTGIEDPGSSR